MSWNAYGAPGALYARRFDSLCERCGDGHGVPTLKGLRRTMRTRRAHKGYVYRKKAHSVTNSLVVLLQSPRNTTLVDRLCVQGGSSGAEQSRTRWHTALRRLVRIHGDAATRSTGDRSLAPLPPHNRPWRCLSCCRRSRPSVYRTCPRVCRLRTKRTKSGLLQPKAYPRLEIGAVALIPHGSVTSSPTVAGWK